MSIVCHKSISLQYSHFKSLERMKELIGAFIVKQYHINKKHLNGFIFQLNNHCQPIQLLMITTTNFFLIGYEIAELIKAK